MEGEEEGDVYDIMMLYNLVLLGCWYLMRVLKVWKMGG